MFDFSALHTFFSGEKTVPAVIGDLTLRHINPNDAETKTRLHEIDTFTESLMPGDSFDETDFAITNNERVIIGIYEKTLLIGWLYVYEPDKIQQNWLKKNVSENQFIEVSYAKHPNTPSGWMGTVFSYFTDIFCTLYPKTSLVGYAAHDNPKSAAILKKAGFTFSGNSFYEDTDVLPDDVYTFQRSL